MSAALITLSTVARCPRLDALISRAADWVHGLAYLWRRLELLKRIENWSLTSLQQRLVKTGGRLVKHARYYWLFLAEGQLNRRRFGAMPGRIALLPVRTG